MERKKGKRIGVILAGGESRRFRSPKAFAEYGKRPFYELALEALSPHADQTMVISHPSLTDRFKKETQGMILEDAPEFQGKGPLAGLYSAMKEEPGQSYFLLACDMPRFSAETAGKILAAREEGADAVVPLIGGRIQPLAAVYEFSAFLPLKEQLESGNYRMIHFLDRIKTKYITEQELGEDDTSFQNINDRDEYRKLPQNHEK
ncbi:molybdenum cofactor guanylyltransferase [Bacillus massiliglaciei]|uniref:molybdenum cofactor guanylyltransferase n=1 Tax=Bacillus massiliglaciei TaxID=1816693 RepID=UPI0018FE4BB7|nr:molybdenum cofactor guanylyltransferase [Bacillus massiliglaciei]